MVRKLVIEEDGGYLGSAIFIAVIVAILGVAFLDGASVYAAYSRAGEGANEAARIAYLEYKDSRNLYLAEATAQEFCESSGLEFVSFEDLSQEGLEFRVTCAQDANTIAFKYIPSLKDLTRQEVSARPQTF